MKLFNSLTKTKEEFKPISENGEVKMYTCGPTVYSRAHIGNMRSYIFMDTLKRALLFNHYTVKNVMNITDVGHLTSDEDDGDDKMEVSAKKENLTPYEIAEKYTKLFIDDIKKLNILMPTKLVKATDHIQEMIDINKKLEQNGYTYKIDDGIYFDTKKFKDYGELSKMPQEEGVSRIGVNEQKHNAKDFALWKFVEPGHIMKWNSPWGVGCPGWHIECSAMSIKYLGEYIDIHTGGEDHYYVHHENEIAQNNCSLGHKVVNIWMHCFFLQVDGGKMSKSLGNIYSLDDLINKGFSPMNYRYFLLQAHYRKRVNFTFEAMESAKTGYERLHALVQSNKEVKTSLTSNDIFKLSNYMDKFASAINDNLNTSEALAIMWEMLKDMPKSEDVYHYALRMDEALGLMLDTPIEEDKINIPQEVQDMANARWQAKKDKNYTLADELRSKITEQGFDIKDSVTGYEIIKK